jgi:riboflavin transporter FmnP
MKERRNEIRRVILIAIFTALSTILYHLKFPLPFIFPAFLDIQFSNLPAIICGLTLGPVSGAVVVVLRTLIKLPFTGSFGVGELADLIIGLAVVLTSSIYYQYHKTRKGGLIALLLSSVAWIITAVVANYFVLIPFYEELLGFDTLYAALEIVPGITRTNYMLYYILFAVIPFNLLLSTLVNVVTYFVYKKVSIFTKEFTEIKS